MQLARRITAWTGTAMICALITLASMTGAQWVKDHPAAVEWTEIALAVGSLACAVFWFSTREKQSSSPTNSGNQVGGGNTGKMIAAGRDIHFHEAPSQPQPQPEVPKYTFIEPLPPISPRPLEFELRFETFPLIYQVASSAWVKATQFDHDAKQAVVAWFTNPPAPAGASGVNGSKLSARLRYSIKGERGPFLLGYWLNRSENEISINPARSAGLIIGLAEWSRWVSYSNPYQWSADMEFLQPAFRPLGEKAEMPMTDMEVEVSLLSKGTTTVDQRTIRLIFADGRLKEVKSP